MLVPVPIGSTTVPAGSSPVVTTACQSSPITALTMKYSSRDPDVTKGPALSTIWRILAGRGCVVSQPHKRGIIAAITFALLFLMTGSVVVPLKALLLNVLSLTAAFGALMWIFRHPRAGASRSGVHALDGPVQLVGAGIASAPL